jgi:hypothetical protein
MNTLNHPSRAGDAARQTRPGIAESATPLPPAPLTARTQGRSVSYLRQVIDACSAGTGRVVAVNVGEAITAAERLLPGEPAPEGERDPRWQAIIAVGEHIEAEPEAVWRFIERWGSHPQEDLRDAIATCLLEHLLEHHFVAFFPRVEARALREPLFGDTFRRCWWFGDAKAPSNAAQVARLLSRLDVAGCPAGMSRPAPGRRR